MKELQEEATEKLRVDDGVQFEPIDGETELCAPEVYAGNLLEWAVECHSSDLFVSDCESCVLVSVRRMGTIQPVRRLARGYGRKLQGYLRVAAGSDAGETIRPTEGRGVVTTPGGRRVDLRLSTIPTLYGTDVSIRLFDPQVGDRRLDQLGLDETEVKALRSMVRSPSGLILVAGPVASGKSSTLYAALHELNDGRQKIHTLEDPIERSIDGVMQSQINPKAGLDFPDLLGTLMRHSPDIIMIGEIRDPETATTAVRAGASGQLVLATIHSQSAADAVDSMLHYGVPSKFLANALIGVVCQRLVRRLCPKCRMLLSIDESIPGADAFSDRLKDVAPGLFVAKGCSECHGDGYSELMCLPEIMAVGDELTAAIRQQEPTAVLHEIATREGMLSLAQKAALRVYQGQMTSADANRAASSEVLASLDKLTRQAITLIEEGSPDGDLTLA